MSAVLITILLVVAIVAIIYYLVKKFTVLLVNAVLGIVLLFLLNFLHVMQWMGKPDLGYDFATVLISAIGGLPGVCILVLLDIFGVAL
ncbi:MAG: pro-sigmaK processing inhibitor BofA family protein [Methanoregula sp.]|nr:pro-sigmaK processing inhibitor BofA family protein [Methanoregula sp.]MDP2796239.1 pro-sigmaK processing inhibitor BofA family protein [Methanoregula sp.]